MTDKESPERYRALFGSLRYVFYESDSLLLKSYALVFLGASGFLTIFFSLAVIYWLGNLQDQPPTGEIWGFVPLLILIYLALEAILFLPIYIPVRLYRRKHID